MEDSVMDSTMSRFDRYVYILIYPPEFEKDTSVSAHSLSYFDIYFKSDNAGTLVA